MQFAGEFIVQGLPVSVMWSTACRPITRVGRDTHAETRTS